MAGLRRCSKCGDHKLPDFFSRGSHWCKACKADASRKWRKENPEKAKDSNRIYRHRYAGSKVNGYRLKYRYNITLDDHKNMMNMQEGVCAICLHPFEKTPHVDHCHKTGVVRGLLCDRCNRGIGYFADSPNRLAMAISYLERYQQ